MMSHRSDSNYAVYAFPVVTVTSVRHHRCFAMRVYLTQGAKNCSGRSTIAAATRNLQRQADQLVEPSWNFSKIQTFQNYNVLREQNVMGFILLRGESFYRQIIYSYEFDS